MDFLMFVVYGAAAVASLVFLILFLFGRLLGGILDETGAPAARLADEAARVDALQALAAPTTVTGRIGRTINTMGDNLQRAAGLGLFFSLLIMGAFAGLVWWTTGDHLFIAVVAALGAGNMLYYLSAEPPDRAKRAILVSVLLTVLVVAAVLIQVGFKNSTEWYNPQIAAGHLTVDGKTEDFPILSTPNGTYLDLQKLVGVDANRVKGFKEDGVFLATCLPGLNPDLAGYETRCHEGKLQLRAQRAKPHSLNLAAHEYSSMQELVLARQNEDLDAAEAQADIEERKARLVEGNKSWFSTMSGPSANTWWAILAGVLVLALVTLLALAAAKKWDAKWPLAVVALVLVTGAAYAGYRALQSASSPAVASNSPSDPAGRSAAQDAPPLPIKAEVKDPPVPARIKVSAARHAKMCAILHPVEDAEQRRLARCP